jgi:hypothetical protein
VRDIKPRYFCCSEIDEIVTLIEYTRNDSGFEVVRGVLHCSHQDLCSERRMEQGEQRLPRTRCPYCLEGSPDK